MSIVKLNSRDMQELIDALHYLKVGELKKVCEQLELPFNGVKGALIERIVTFLETGKIITLSTMPAASKGKRGAPRILALNERMLNGVYKNDAATRAFFKKVIGNYFHFTAFGIDWLNERWFAGNPPTYGEFAAFWVAEYAARKHKKAEPKKEWALLNFVQRFLAQYPTATREVVVAMWNQERRLHVEKVKRILGVEI